MNDIKPSRLAAAAGISISYASQILGGTRQPSKDIALAAFRAFGVRLGLLADLTDADLEQLCSGRVCDAVHAQTDTGEGAALSAFKTAPDFNSGAQQGEAAWRCNSNQRGAGR